MSQSRDLVPVSSREIVPVQKGQLGSVKRASKEGNPLLLVPEQLTLHNREEVRSYLPDILGRALARMWIDKAFSDHFSQEPKSALEAAGVMLPETMSIEFSKASRDRPKLIVYEQRPNSKFKMRVFYLQLVMMAGK